MRVTLGAGWQLTHKTDRVIKLEKNDWTYRRYTGRDGFVLVRGEPGMDDQSLLNKAIAMAKRNDEQLAERVAKELIPRRLGGYQMRQRQLAQIFGVPSEEPEEPFTCSGRSGVASWPRIGGSSPGLMARPLNQAALGEDQDLRLKPGARTLASRVIRLTPSRQRRPQPHYCEQ
jgi:hypothetical protein